MVPVVGDVVSLRRHTWLTEAVIAPPAPGDLTRVRLVCIDGADEGHTLEVLWELELGRATARQGKERDLAAAKSNVDPASDFFAALSVARWSGVSATRPKVWQAPFRAGIEIMAHQLTPLKRALSGPRANLFIADDVGLGKTIEAGLVISELMSRKRVDFVVVACPAAVVLQWHAEMSRRFGIRFEIMSRAFANERRRELGFTVNPWATAPAFIVSHALLRRPEYSDGLVARMTESMPRSVFVLDEAHAAAPASASRYAVDSHTTTAVRDIASRFEHRIFSSATPHNGHSNSFAALLEILDPARFTRGVPVESVAELEPIMVRRSKAELAALGVGGYPKREVIRIDVGEGETPAPEVALAELLAKYTEVARPKAGVGKLVFIMLQKRLLSSVRAFAKTLEVHARSIGAKGSLPDPTPRPVVDEDSDSGLGDSEEAEANADTTEARVSSAAIESLDEEARRLLAELSREAARLADEPDAKLLALIDWIRTHQCAGARDPREKKKRGRAKPASWSDRRVIIFTEYADTKTWLVERLSAAIEGTDGASERIVELSGGMDADSRARIQRNWNAAPDAGPARILIATDAAREGINLQGHCSDLFHFDVPWNPARMEQRNGRIDRALQRAPVVRCHWFFYPSRREDQVLAALVEKVGTIERELGPLALALGVRVETALDGGIDGETRKKLELARPTDEGSRRAVIDIERVTKGEALAVDLEENQRLLAKSQKAMDFDPSRLHAAVIAGLRRLGLPPLVATADPTIWKLPDLPHSWQDTVDWLRPPRERQESFWEWRKRAPDPVRFDRAADIDDSVVGLYLEHPFVKRVLSALAADTTSSIRGRRSIVAVDAADSHVLVAWARVAVFGKAATRLHDEVIAEAFSWIPELGTVPAPLRGPGAVKAIALAEERGFAPSNEEPTSEWLAHVEGASETVEGAVWRRMESVASKVVSNVREILERRGRSEANARRKMLVRQIDAIERALADRQQLDLFEVPDPRQQRQYAYDTRHMGARRTELVSEVESGPRAIEASYEVGATRLEPIGWVYLAPRRS